MIRRTFVWTVVITSVVWVGLAQAAEKQGVAIGDQAPQFNAVGVDGLEYSLDSVKGADVTVLCFTCNLCPVAVAYEDRFIEFNKQYADKGVQFLAINVNQSENLDAMKQRVEEKGFNFPYMYDESGDAARAYGARVTPHLYVLDAKQKVAYIGAFDDNNNAKKAAKPFLADAVDAVLAGSLPELAQTEARGCNIKPRK